MKFLLGATMLGLLLVSCVDLKKTDQLAKIDAMSKTVDSIEVVFNEHKLDTLAVISNNAFGVENRIKQNYVSDTINMEFGRKMDRFKIMRKNFPSLGKGMSSIKRGLEQERGDLKKLRDDIENGNGEREKYDEFVTFEQKKVDQLRALLTEYVDTKVVAIETYNELYDELNDFSMSLLEKK